MNTQSQSFPAIALALGYSGVIPFVVLAVCIALGFDLNALGITDANGKLISYGAVIISFIGAVHWGVAMHTSGSKQNLLFIYSVIPALVAWVWMFFNDRAALFGMGLTVAAMLFVDRQLLSDSVPRGYLKMRLHLTVVVAGCLLLAALRVTIV